MLNCKELLSSLCESVECGQAGPSCEEIRKHIDNCPDCRLVFDNLRHTVDVCRKGLKDTGPEAEAARDEFKKRLCQMLKERWKQTEKAGGVLQGGVESDEDPPCKELAFRN